MESQAPFEVLVTFVSSIGMIMPCLFGASMYYAIKAKYIGREREVISVIFGSAVGAYGLTIAICAPAPDIWEIVRVVPSAILKGLTVREIWGWWRMYAS